MQLVYIHTNARESVNQEHDVQKEKRVWVECLHCHHHNRLIMSVKGTSGRQWKTLTPYETIMETFRLRGRMGNA